MILILESFEFYIFFYKFIYILYYHPNIYFIKNGP